MKLQCSVHYKTFPSFFFLPSFPPAYSFKAKCSWVSQSCKNWFQTYSTWSTPYPVFKVSLLSSKVSIRSSQSSVFWEQSVINPDLTKLQYSFGSITSHFLKGEQMFLLSSLFSFCRALLLQSADAPSVLLCLSVLGPGHSQGFRRNFNSRTSTLNRLFIRRKFTSLFRVSKTPRSLVLLSVALFEPFSDQEPLHQQSPVGERPLF